MEKGEVIRIEDPADPERCQGSRRGQQCVFKMIPGNPAKRCPVCISAHAGKIDRDSIYQFNLTQWRDRLSRLSDDAGIKSLRDEIGILRMALEAVINRCTTDDDLILQSNKIGDLATKIEHVLVSCNKLEKTTGMMMDKTTALNMAGTIVEIISQNVTDPDIVEKISNEIIEKVLNVEYVP